MKRQAHKMVKHTQTTRRLFPTNCLSVFEHFVEVALEGLILEFNGRISNIFKPFLANVPISYPPENTRRYKMGYKIGPLVRNGSTYKIMGNGVS